ncbi:isopeptide-forming domain-containing fimbrial protein [Enterococcus sp. BWR-S5]|uniref:isopeptide-forming domain-containing fimbrial protein n=1 Tax=Enterococcus sp. BWR-S5 TaxID=2787714 RepID=UPI001922BC58|nr:isopeptide-forming domain-containing fimbrial protein [Enterococcus sp. BWR-S5]MBL1226008.1 isopeptide-forming domain-containing fimbrial protein [Enterococcus sp. BWR-S5]
MRIAKKFYFVLCLTIAVFLIAGISRFVTVDKIQANESNYGLEIVDSNYKSTDYLQLKLTVPNAKKEQLRLEFDEVSDYDVELFADGLNEANQKKVSVKVDESDYLKGVELDFSGNGEVFSVTFVVLPDNESALETGSVAIKNSNGDILSSITFDTNSDIVSNDDMTEMEGQVEVAEEKILDSELQLSSMSGISPLAIDLPTPTNPVDVSTWSELQTALTSTTIDWINLKADISFGAAVTVTTSKVINGLDGATKRSLNFLGRAVTLGTASAGSFVALQDVDISGTNTAAMFTSGTTPSANWELRMNNVNVVSGNVSALFSGVQSSVVISGESKLNITGTGALITAKDLKITDKAKVDAELGGIFYLSARVDTTLTVNEGSKLKVNSSGNTNIIHVTNTANFKFDGDGTEVTLNGNSSGGGASDAIMLLRSGAVVSTIDVTQGAKVNVNSLSEPNGSPAVLMESEGGKFTVSDKSEFNAYGKNTDGGSLAATVRFYAQGGNVFEAKTGSKISIIRDAGNQSALRMYSNNNGVIVSGGSDFILKSAGDGTPRDPGSNGRNQGIQFRNGSTSETSYFKVTGENSNVSLEAGYGTTIDCDDQLLDVEVGEGAYFVVRGRTASSNTGVFSSRRNTTKFTMTKPKYFDFRNDSSGGGLIFENLESYRVNASLTTYSTFDMTGSDLSVWEDGVDLDGNPSKSWTILNSTWTGDNYSKGTSDNIDFNSTFKGAPAYSRMTANNQTAVIDELRVPTNADKYIWGHASVPEGKGEEPRDAYTDEVFVRVRVYRNGNSADYYETVGASIGDDGDDDGISVYGDDPRAGIFKIDVPNDEFLTKNDKIEVIGAWRGLKENEGSEKVHTSTASDLQAPDRVVLDVTPPNPTSLIGATLNNATKVLSGENAEAGALVHVYYDSGDSATGTLLGTAIVESDGRWTFNLPHYVEKTKELSIYLSDDAGQHTAAQVVSGTGATTELYDQVGLIKPPATNISTGNINPYNDYAYHDAVFKGVNKYTAKDVIPDNPSLEKVAASSGGATTSVGDTLTYTLTGKNGKADSEDWANVVLEDTLPEGLDFDTANHGITIKTVDALGNETDVPLEADSFEYNPTTRLLKIKVGNVPALNGFIVTFEATVNREKIGQDILNTAEAKGFSPQEDKNPFVPGPIDPDGPFKPINVSVSKPAGLPGGELLGILELSSAPDVINFEKHALTVNDTRVEEPDLSAPLTVSDNRGNRTSWTLTAKLTDVMANTDDSTKILADAIKFNNGTTEESLSLNTELTIKTHTHTAPVDYVVSDDWSVGGAGLKLEVPAGGVPKLGKYKAEITWILGDTPTP